MKRLLCFFDGTWNKPDVKDELTNVVKLYSAVPHRATDGTTQVKHYEIGIATKENYGRLTFAAGAIGIDVPDRIKSGLKFLVENYAAGDEIYIFGFSRGAFEARSLGGILSLTGVPKRGATDQQIDAIWDYYREHKDAPDDARISDFRAGAHYPTRIRCIGVWDTVGNFGVPLIGRSKLNQALTFHDTGLSPIVDVGLHALSIDEPRRPFRPTFWTKLKDDPLPEGQVIEQVWFPGCHANVGGGYKNSTLSDISLIWMAERVTQLTGAEIDFTHLKQLAEPDPLGEAVQPTSDAVFRVSQFMPFVRLIKQNVKGISPWRRTFIGTWRTSRVLAGEEVVNESVHPSALERYGKRVKVRCGDAVKAVRYRPRQLRVLMKRKKKDGA